MVRDDEPVVLVRSREDLAGRLAAVAATGRLVVLSGPSGAGRTEVLRGVARLHEGPVIVGGGLAGLRTAPNLALSRALRLPVPATDSARAADFVLAAAGRSTLLVLDDLQLCDPTTLEVVVLLAGQLPIVGAVTDDSEIGARLSTALARLSLTVSAALAPLEAAEAAEFARASYRGSDASAVRSIVRTADGNPGALVAFAHDPHASDLRLAVANRLALLSTRARTVLCLLGLLGRPAEVAMVGSPLAQAACGEGVVREVDGWLTPRSNLDAEVAVAILPALQRRSLHAQLARRVRDPGEQARHFEAAGDPGSAVSAAREAANSAGTPLERVRYESIAARLTPGPARGDACLAVAMTSADCGDHALAMDMAAASGAGTDWRVGLIAARAALSVGDSAGALSYLYSLDGSAQDTDQGPEQALLVAVERARALCLFDPVEAMAVAADAYGAAVSDEHLARAGGVLGAAQLAAGAEGWCATLEAAEAHAHDCGLQDVAFAACANRCSGLLRHGHPDKAYDLAMSSASAAKEAGATSWAVRFKTVGLWVDIHVRAALSEGLTTGEALLDGPLPPALRREVTAQVALAFADSSQFATARAHIDGLDTGQDDLLGWCDAELRALEGDPRDAGTKAVAVLARARAWPVPALAAVTAAWAGMPGNDSVEGRSLAGGATQELAALAARDGNPVRAAALFADAAKRWEGLSRRSVLRCRLAAALSSAPVGRADALIKLRRLSGVLEREQLSVLAMQVTRARRQLGDTELPTVATGPRNATLSRREAAVMAEVAHGLTSAAIAARLGVAPSTVETQVKSAMRKLGATTRTEAAVRALR